MIKKVLTVTLLSSAISATCSAATVDLRVLETTDLHGNMMDYDYYKDKATDRFGLTRTATLIQQARSEATNSVLVDNGDIIQGSPMADYVYSKGLQRGDIHPVYKALNSLQYTVGGLGNHEFNYGLDYLKKAIAGARFPYINANVFDAQTGEHYFKPYLIVNTKVNDRNGKSHQVKIGYISFVPPQIMEWDKSHLSGKVIVKDITETARQLVPEMKKQGADLIIVIAHSGVSADPYKALAENSVYYLSQVKGVDAIMFGHSHAVFPSKDFSHLPGVDLESGTLNGVPAVMPGQWGDHLGVVDLVLDGKNGNWKVISRHAEARPIFDKAEQRSLVDPDEKLRHVMHDDHQHTRDYVNQPIGVAADNLYGFLALVQDDPTQQVVNEAQKAYVEHFIQGDPDLANLPVLSAIAPFKAGGRENDPHAYVEVAKGDLSLRNAADLYVFSNTLVAVKATGAEVREWLECSAGIFNQIDIHNPKPQNLINWDNRTYNFDTIDGLVYQIDVTQPPRYDKDCKLINPDSHRIVNLTYQGQAIPLKQDFLVATNNYRAYTGKFAGTGEDHIAFAAPDEVRSILIDYIRKQTKVKGNLSVKLDHNWQIAQIADSKIPLDIRLQTSPSETASEFIKQHAQYPMAFIGKDKIGFAVYRIDLQSQPKLD